MASKIKLSNANGKIVTIENNDSNMSDVTLNGASITKKVDTLANMRTMNELPETVWLSGYHTKNDGAFGSHFFRLKGLKTTETDNGGIIIIVSVGGSDYVYELQFDGAVNVKWFGAGKGEDDTTAVKNAISYSKEIYLPAGVYTITEPLGSITKAKLYGSGRDTIINIAFDGFAFEDSDGDSISYDYGYLQFYTNATLYPNAGGFNLVGNTRGSSIHDVWFLGIARPIKTGALIYGELIIRNIYAYYFQPTTSIHTAIDLRSNTLFLENIEVIGNWTTGVSISSGAVASINNFNIGGSTTTYQMTNGIRVTDYTSVTIKNGWIEQLDDTSGNGNANALYFSNTKATVESVLIATGSIFAYSNSNIITKSISFSQVLGAFRSYTLSTIYCDEKDLKYTPLGTSGYLKLNNNINRDGYDTHFGNRLGILNGFGSPSGGTVTITDDSSTFYSFDSSKKVVSTVAFQGVLFTLPTANYKYPLTISARVKTSKGFLIMGQGTSTVDAKYNGKHYTSGNEWELVSVTISSGYQFKLTISEAGTFYIDDVVVYSGYGLEDPSLLSVQRTYLGFNAPTSGSWLARDIVYTYSPAASGNIGWVCITAGTPGTWKAFGTISA